ncbi:PAS domain S-box protein [Rubinisphaera margarita]|uniref:PAS domain S-box protein n=1 Tax=Rubinisphaera margarita TaxID=2909586 RepID=UPI001EE7A56A|nr:PAS domain S-box protein [Rubinisphaera margarita]MCG6156480.1 PAS domain S-box protein [Rubinisphaera margarita]
MSPVAIWNQLRGRPRVFGYGIAFVSSILAAILGVLIHRYLTTQVVFSTFFLSVVLSACYGGFGPGLLAIVLGSFSALQFILTPEGPLFSVSSAEQGRLTIFILLSLMTTAIICWTRFRFYLAALDKERLSVTLASIADAVIATDARGAVSFLNRNAEELTGWTLEEAAGKPLDEVFRIIDESTGEGSLPSSEQGQSTDSFAGLHARTLLIARDETTRPIQHTVAPIKDRTNSEIGLVFVFRDITMKREAERAAAEQARLLKLRSGLGAVLAQELLLPEALQKCAQLIVDHLEVQQVDIWCFDFATGLLELTARAGLGSDSGSESLRLSPGESLIGKIARSRSPRFLSHAPDSSSETGDQVAQDAAAFLGYPLFIEDRGLGVLTLSTNRPLSHTVKENIPPLTESLSQFLERKRQEEALRNNEKLHRTLAELASDYGCIGRIHPDGQVEIEWVTSGFQRVTGYTLDELNAAGGWQILVPEDQLKSVEVSIGQWLEHGVHRSETSIITREGNTRHVEYFGRAERDAKSEDVRVYLAARDITESRIAAEKFRQQQEWFEVTLSSIGDAVIATDENGAITFLNRVAARLTEWSKEEALGRPLRDVFNILHEGTREPVENPVEKVLRNGEIVGLSNHTILVTRSGSEFPIDDGAAPIRDNSGAIIGVVLIFRDMTDRREAERQIANRDWRYRMISDASHDVIWDWDLKKHQITWNDSVKNRFGYETVESSLDWWAERVHPDDRDRVVDGLESVIQSNEEKWVDEYRFQRSDGTYAYIIDRGKVLRNGDGEGLRMVGSMVDLTDRQEAENRLRESEERLRLAVESTHIGTFDYSPLTGELEWSDRCKSALGVPIDEDVNIDIFFERLHPDDREQVERKLQEALDPNGDGRYAAEYRSVWPDGTIRWIDAQGQAFFTEEGSRRVACRLIGTVLDTTERKKAEDDLKLSMERFRNLADSISQFAWMADETGYIHWYNQRWFEYTGTTLEEMEGWGWDKVHHPDFVEEVTERFQAACQSGTPWEDTFPLKGRDGKFRWFLSRAMPIKNEDGQIIRWVGTNTDVTTQMELQDELRSIAAKLSEADRRKDDFLATLAHELRNPLAPIRTGLEVMKHTQGDAETLEEVRSVMERQTHQLIVLVDDLLDISRITRGKLELRKCRVNLNEVVNSAVEASSPLIDDNLHQLEVILPDEPITIEADPHRLAQVVSNLLNNAAKYTIDGGTIRLSIEKLEEHVLISVADNGIGIPSEMTHQIFEMFAQIDRPMEKGYTGLGIGLTLVKSLVEMHDGTIEVQSDGLNQGSQFRVRLPLGTPRPDYNGEQSSEEEKEPPSPTLQKILVVDDNKAAADLLAMIVRMLGHEVRIANDGREGVDAAREFRPDVILMDIGMPRMNGYEAARLIRNQEWGDDIHLVALTGWGQDEDRRRTQDAGFDHHLVKPAEPADLLKVLAEGRPETK